MPRIFQRLLLGRFQLDVPCDDSHGIDMRPLPGPGLWSTDNQIGFLVHGDGIDRVLHDKTRDTHHQRKHIFQQFNRTEAEAHQRFVDLLPARPQGALFRVGLRES